jgi:hypothetical protein
VNMQETQPPVLTLNVGCATDPRASHQKIKTILIPPRRITRHFL